jgi:hypothetical protein
VRADGADAKELNPSPLNAGLVRGDAGYSICRISLRVCRISSRIWPRSAIASRV